MLEPASDYRNVTIKQSTDATPKPEVSAVTNRPDIVLQNTTATMPFDITVGVSTNNGCVLNTNGTGTCPPDAGSTFTATVTRDSTLLSTIPTTVGISDTNSTYVIRYKLCGYYRPTANADEVLGCDSTKTSTVKVVLMASGGNDPKAVIVFSKYIYNNIDGKPFTSPDTAFKVGGTFREPAIGSITAYYGTNKTNIPVTLDGNLTRSYNIGSTPNPSGYNVTYTLAAGTGYTSAEATRKVYLTADGECEGTPGMTFTSASNITIPLNTPQPWWSVISASFTPAGRDFVDGRNEMRNPTYKFSIYSTPTLDLDNPTTGTYTINYVALHICAASGGNGLRLFPSDNKTLIVSNP
jgi:hypothetical protein